MYSPANSLILENIILEGKIVLFVQEIIYLCHKVEHQLKKKFVWGSKDGLELQMNFLDLYAIWWVWFYKNIKRLKRSKIKIKNNPSLKANDTSVKNH